MDLPTELVLDYRIWRSGGHRAEGLNKVGKGDTSLLNEEGYMCCLGQFCQQAGVIKHYLVNREYPCELDNAPKLFVSNGNMTDLAGLATDINDDGFSSVAERVMKLQALFEKHGRTIVLQNFPAQILKQIEQERRGSET